MPTCRPTREESRPVGPRSRIAVGVLAACLVTSSLVVVEPIHRASALEVNRPVVGVARTPDGKGYWEVASDGGVFAFGGAGFDGSTGNLHLNQPVVGMAATPDGKGYWMVAADGGVFAFGDAPFYGSTGNLHLNQPVVGMAATPDGKGYWMVAADGGVFAFGGAGFDGSTGNLHLNQPVVGMAATPDGKGYWMVAADGGVFAFGDAPFYGSTGNLHLNQPVVGMAATPDGKGYWMVAADGGVFAFGGAGFDGSTGNIHLNQPVVGMAATPDGKGYWMVAADGGVFAFGDAGFYGSAPLLPPPGPPRIALYGDSLVSEAAQDFQYLAGVSGATVRIRTFGGTAICDFLGMMATDAQSWQPTAAVLAFSGDDFTPCMAGYTLGTPQYYEKYQQDLEAAISIFRGVGTTVVVVGLPLDESASLSQNVVALNHIYQSVAQSHTGVVYDDAGQAVMANGAFTWTLPCLSFEPCTGPSGTNIVRAPDGIHFCPNGQTSLVGDLEICDVYSSGAFRFASAMLGAALDAP